jgi:hypothetical protein
MRGVEMDDKRREWFAIFGHILEREAVLIFPMPIFALLVSVFWPAPYVVV